MVLILVSVLVNYYNPGSSNIWVIYDNLQFFNELSTQKHEMYFLMYTILRFGIKEIDLFLNNEILMF